MKRLAVPRLTWVALAFALATIFAAALFLWHLRREGLEVQGREIELLSAALTDDLERGLRGVEVGLHAIGEEVRVRRIALAGAEADAALRTRVEVMPLVRTVWLVDAQGRIAAASDSAPPPDLATFYPSLDHLGEVGMTLSRPFAGKGGDQLLVALAYGLRNAAGAEDGWLVASVRAADLLGAFSATSPAADARMAVYRADGARLSGSIVATPRLDEAAVAQRLAGMRSLDVRRFRDGSERLVSLHVLQRYGLSVVLTRDVETVLGPWRQVAFLTGIGAIALLGVLVASVWLVARADRRRAEAQAAVQAQIARASKLESLGTLAGGVAHDFNNVLAAIIGYAEMAQDAAKPGTDQARHLGKVLQASLRGRSLVERILAFSRGGARASIVFELEPVVSEVLTLLSASLRPGVVIEKAFDAPGARVQGDATLAFEAIMNLCTNGLQAMPAGGRLTVQVTREHVAAARVLSHSRLAPARYVVLRVADEGVGIAPESMERLFEPFFTTRGDQAGTGLGLAVVHGVVNEFGGALDVQSAAGRGASFTVYFPESQGKASVAATTPAAQGGAGQTVLVLDDEPTLVAMAKEMLDGLGYRTMAFTDAPAALEAFAADPERVDAVVTDEVMPGLNGTQFTEKLRARAPTLPVLLVSGYGGALLAARAATAGVTRVLAKPLQRAELARALADLLH